MPILINLPFKPKLHLRKKKVSKNLPAYIVGRFFYFLGGGFIRKKLIYYLTAFLIVFLITLLPWLIQWFATSNGSIPTGFISGGVDYHTFIAKMKWGMGGHWTYENRFTGEKTAPVPIYQFYLFLGHLAGWTGISIPWMYHLSRSILGAITALLLWRFLKRYVPVNPVIAIILTIMASGGYLVICDQLFSTQLNADSTDTFLQGRVWLAYLTFPHYFLDMLGILLLLESYLAAYSYFALPGGLLISLAHPFLMALFCPVILISSIFRKDFKQAFVSCALASLGALPVAVPMYLAIQKVEWLNIWREQTYRKTPPFWKFFVVGYGLTGIAGWYELYYKTIREKDRVMVLWATWLVLSVIFSYFAPIPNKREFAFFITIPLGILATPLITCGVKWLLVNTKGAKSKLAATLLLLTCIWYGVVIYGQCLVSFKPTDTFTGYYITPEYQRVFKLIDETGTDQVVLAADWLGNLIPAYTKSRPYVGHLCETLDFKGKFERNKDFLKGKMTEKEMRSLLAANNISWIIYDKNSVKEDKLSTKLGRPVFKGEELIVWKVE